MARALDAEQLREALFAEIKKHPDGIKTSDLAVAVLGNTNDEGERKNRHARTFYQLGQLKKAKHVAQKGSIWTVKHDRPTPNVHDIPDAPKRARKGSIAAVSGTSENNRMRRYAFAQIRMALGVLEGLEGQD